MQHPCLKQRFDDTVARYSMIEEGDTVLLGLSGGADSVCLFHLLLELQKKIPFSLHACHFHHGIRGDEADGDEAFVKELCEKNNVPFHLKRANVPDEAKISGESVEECARRLRYGFFEELCLKYGITRIAVAHNLSDRSETLLFNLARGSGISGLRSIPPKRDKIIRPLIDCTKDEILEYCEKHGYEFRTDSTNFNTDYARNYIRHRVLPSLRELSPVFDRSVATLCENLMELEDMVDSQAEAFLSESCQNGRVNREKLKKIHPFAAKRAIDMLYKRTKGNNNTQSLEKIHLDTALDFILNSSSGRSIDMPGGLKLRIEYDFAFFTKDTDLKPSELVLCEGGNCTFAGDICLDIFDKSAPNAPDIVYTLFKQAFLDYDKIVGEVTLRTRKTGDSVKSKGMTKSVKRFFTDKKIPLSERDFYPIFCDETGIIWVPGLAVDDRVKIDENTKKVLNIKIKE